MNCIEGLKVLLASREICRRGRNSLSLFLLLMLFHPIPGRKGHQVSLSVCSSLQSVPYLYYNKYMGFYNHHHHLKNCVFLHHTWENKSYFLRKKPIKWALWWFEPTWSQYPLYWAGKLLFFLQMGSSKFTDSRPVMCGNKSELATLHWMYLHCKWILQEYILSCLDIYYIAEIFTPNWN